MMQSEVGTNVEWYPVITGDFPCGVASMKGKDALDFLQRISTNDLEGLAENGIRRTLLLSDKGRVIDAVWVIRSGEELLLITSAGMVKQVITFLDRYIIMDDVIVSDVSDVMSVTMQFGHGVDGYRTEFFGHPATFLIHQRTGMTAELSPEFDRWRILHGIPAAGKELVQDFNPLELNLWDWISFTKGCYLGQEVVARLDTYQKVQRSLCRFSSGGPIAEGSKLHDADGNEVGKVTSAFTVDQGSIGLAIIRRASAVPQLQLITADRGMKLIIEQVFQQEDHGRD